MSLDPAEGAAFRYRPLVKLASGGMATVYVGALQGPSGFRQIVAIKRPHAHLLEDPGTREEALSEARIAARIHHANVVDVRDVEVSGDAIQLVMDYIEGATLSTLLAAFARRGAQIPEPIAARILLDACAGLTAVHELTDDTGARLHLVHRDISPQNILVGIDGVARISDFGTVKEPASSRPLTTQGTLKGKPGYMAPEYVQRGALDARSDELSLAVVAWETLVGKRLFRGATDFDTFERVLRETPAAPSAEVPGLGAFDEVLARGLAKDPDRRYPTVRDFGEAFARACAEIAPYSAVADLVNDVVGEELRTRRTEVRARLAAMDAETTGTRESGTPPAPASASGGEPAASSTRTAVTAREVSPAAERERTLASAVRPAPRGRLWIAIGLVFSAIVVMTGTAMVTSGGSSAPLGATSAPPVEAASAALTAPVVAPVSAASSAPGVPSGAASSTAPGAPSSARVPSKTDKGAVTATSSAASTSGKRVPRPPPPNPY